MYWHYNYSYFIDKDRLRDNRNSMYLTHHFFQNVLHRQDTSCQCHLSCETERKHTHKLLIVKTLYQNSNATKSNTEYVLSYCIENDIPSLNIKLSSIAVTVKCQLGLLHNSVLDLPTNQAIFNFCPI